MIYNVDKRANGNVVFSDRLLDCFPIVGEVCQEVMKSEK